MGAGSEDGDLRLLSEIGLTRGMNLVEFGCGSGSFARLAAAAVGSSGHVVGVDLSAFNVARARELSARDHLANVSFEVSDAVRTGLAADFADFCVARGLLGHVPSPGAVVKEMARVARPGGTVAVWDLDEGLVLYEPEPPAVAELRALIARDRLSAGGNRLLGRALFRLLSEAGLESVRVSVSVANSTEPDAPPPGGPAGHTAFLARAAGALAEMGAISREDQARFERALDEVARNPLGFALVGRFFAHGRKPLRCA